MLHFGLFARRRGEGMGEMVVKVLGKARQSRVGQSLQCSAKWSPLCETRLQVRPVVNGIRITGCQAHGYGDCR